MAQTILGGKVRQDSDAQRQLAEEDGGGFQIGGKRGVQGWASTAAIGLIVSDGPLWMRLAARVAVVQGGVVRLQWQ